MRNINSANDTDALLGTVERVRDSYLEAIYDLSRFGQGASEEEDLVRESLLNAMDHDYNAITDHLFSANADPVIGQELVRDFVGLYGDSDKPAQDWAAAGRDPNRLAHGKLTERLRELQREQVIDDAVKQAGFLFPAGERPETPAGQEPWAEWEYDAESRPGQAAVAALKAEYGKLVESWREHAAYRPEIDYTAKLDELEADFARYLSVEELVERLRELREGGSNIQGARIGAMHVREEVAEQMTSWALGDGAGITDDAENERAWLLKSMIETMNREFDEAQTTGDYLAFCSKYEEYRTGVFWRKYKALLASGDTSIEHGRFLASWDRLNDEAIEVSHNITKQYAVQATHFDAMSTVLDEAVALEEKWGPLRRYDPAVDWTEKLTELRDEYAPYTDEQKVKDRIERIVEGADRQPDEDADQMT